MSMYLSPMITAIAVFPILAALIAFPFALVQYHKYGSIPWLKVLIFFTFAYYMLTIYFLIILPLPDKNDLSSFSYAGHIELIPFDNILDYFRKKPFTMDLSYILTFLKSPCFYELAFNILMVVPFGMYLRYYFKCGLKKTFFLSFLLSLFFELTQLSSLYGYYPAPYRTFDTDDLICNTLGGVLGWVLSPAFTFFLPQRRQLDEQSVAASVKVSVWRRGCADIVDVILFMLIYTAIQFGLSLFQVSWQSSDELYIGAFLFLQWFNASISHGSSPGKSICRIQVCMNDKKKASFLAQLLRYLILWAFVSGNLLLAQWVQKEMMVQTGMMQNILYGTNLLCYVIEIVMVMDVLHAIVMHKPMLYEKISHTEIVSTMPLTPLDTE